MVSPAGSGHLNTTLSIENYQQSSGPHVVSVCNGCVTQTLTFIKTQNPLPDDMETLFTFKSQFGTLTDGNEVSLRPLGQFNNDGGSLDVNNICRPESCQHGGCQVTSTGASRCVCNKFWSGQQCSQGKS